MKGNAGCCGLRFPILLVDPCSLELIGVEEMTVKELIKRLEALENQEADVCVAVWEDETETSAQYFTPDLVDLTGDKEMYAIYPS